MIDTSFHLDEGVSAIGLELEANFELIRLFNLDSNFFMDLSMFHPNPIKSGLLLFEIDERLADRKAIVEDYHHQLHPIKENVFVSFDVLFFSLPVSHRYQRNGLRKTSAKNSHEEDISSMMSLSMKTMTLRYFDYFSTKICCFSMQRTDLFLERKLPAIFHSNGLNSNELE